MSSEKELEQRTCLSPALRRSAEAQPGCLIGGNSDLHAFANPRTVGARHPPRRIRSRGTVLRVIKAALCFPAYDGEPDGVSGAPGAGRLGRPAGAHWPAPGRPARAPGGAPRVGGGTAPGRLRPDGAGVCTGRASSASSSPIPWALLLWVATGLAFVSGASVLGEAIVAVILLNALFAFPSGAAGRTSGRDAAGHRAARRRSPIDHARALVPGDVLFLEEGGVSAYHHRVEGGLHARLEPPRELVQLVARPAIPRSSHAMRERHARSAGSACLTFRRSVCRAGTVTDRGGHGARGPTCSVGSRPPRLPASAHHSPPARAPWTTPA